jgi:hypothetical protein
VTDIHLERAHLVEANRHIATGTRVDVSAPARRRHRTGKDILDGVSITFDRQ